MWCYIFFLIIIGIIIVFIEEIRKNKNDFSKINSPFKSPNYNLLEKKETVDLPLQIQDPFEELLFRIINPRNGRDLKDQFYDYLLSAQRIGGQIADHIGEPIEIQQFIGDSWVMVDKIYPRDKAKVSVQKNRQKMQKEKNNKLDFPKRCPVCLEKLVYKRMDDGNDEFSCPNNHDIGDIYP